MENDIYQPKQRMPVSERAKQFAPFSPLNGLSKALRAQERRSISKPSLCEDQIVCLDRQLKSLVSGMEVSVIFYRDGEVQRIQDRVIGLQAKQRILKLQSQSVLFDELLELRGACLENSGEEDF